MYAELRAIGDRREDVGDRDGREHHREKGHLPEKNPAGGSGLENLNGVHVDAGGYLGGIIP
jgi:hypothetical protein